MLTSCWTFRGAKAASRRTPGDVAAEFPQRSIVTCVWHEPVEAGLVQNPPAQILARLHPGARPHVHGNDDRIETQALVGQMIGVPRRVAAVLVPRQEALLGQPIEASRQDVWRDAKRR